VDGAADSRASSTGGGQDTTANQNPARTEQEALELLQGAKAMLTQAGVSHDLHAKVGQTAETIVSFARDYHCQLIVLGTRGMGAVATFMIGSVANRVVHQTDLPVLLVK